MTSTAVLKSEAYKLRSLNSTPWLLGITALVSLTLSGLAVRSPLEGEEPGLSEVLVGPAFAQFLIMVFASRSATMEFRTGTIWQSRLAVPSWTRLLLGKAGVIAVLAALMGALLGAGGVAVASVVAPDADVVPSSGLEWRQLLTLPVTLAIVAVLSLAIGLLLKSGGATITALLVWALVVEPALSATGDWLAGIDIGPWLPFLALSDFQGQSGGVSFPGGPYLACVYVAAVTAALLATAIKVQERREP
jgi:ABC-2 type transport system permease protein